jgi:hypothetical protein
MALILMPPRARSNVLRQGGNYNWDLPLPGQRQRPPIDLPLQLGPPKSIGAVFFSIPPPRDQAVALARLHVVFPPRLIAVCFFDTMQP